MSANSGIRNQIANHAQLAVLESKLAVGSTTSLVWVVPVSCLICPYFKTAKHCCKAQIESESYGIFRKTKLKFMKEKLYII